MFNETLYSRIMGLLEEKIKSGEYPPGSRIPSERELGDLFGVSRITIRQSLLGLQGKGMLIRRQGKGTFVAHPQIESSLLGYFKFSQALQMQGLLVSTRVLDRKVEPAPPDVARELAIETGEIVIRLVRLRLVDADPFALETTYLPVTRLPGIESAPLDGGSLYTLLEADYGLHPARARETLQPVRLTSGEAKALGVQPDCALLISRTTSDLSGVPFEVARALIPGERCRLLVELWAGDLAQPGTLVNNRVEQGSGASRPSTPR